jgi:hypothetical protein
MSWLGIVLTIFSHLGMMQTSFMSIGPSESTFFMGIKLDSWYKWSWVAVFTFLSTAVNDFVGDSVVPWIQNTIQDHKTRYIPYSKFTCWMITQCWAIYCNIMSIFSIYLLMSQVDFLAIRAVADGIVNSYTTFRFMRTKVTNMDKYKQWYNQDLTLNSRRPSNDIENNTADSLSEAIASAFDARPLMKLPSDQDDQDSCHDQNSTPKPNTTAAS